MKATELRIGNLVNFHNTDNIQVIGLKQDQISYWEEWDLVFNDESKFNPIPLTVKWLIDFGFEYRNEHREEGCILDLRNNDWKKSMSVALLKNGKVRILNHPQYDYEFVHQIQNIYFALNMEELILNKKV